MVLQPKIVVHIGRICERKYVARHHIDLPAEKLPELIIKKYMKDLIKLIYFDLQLTALQQCSSTLLQM